ncbi:MAG: ABC transporter substrate-binding protein [Anaerolineaceae bacterium]|nr:ABC transporter substrate-binding protein [Anaerolineaceae bacterium]
MYKKIYFVLAVLLVFTLAMSACAPSEPETIIKTVVVIETVEVEGEIVEVETIITVEVPVEVEVVAVDEEEAERRKTVIFDIDEEPPADPMNYNPYSGAARQHHGPLQSMMEPLFIYNDMTGEVVPWLAESMTSNEDFTVWTLTLREGIMWSDGEVLDSDDLVFTINLISENPEFSARSDFSNVETFEKVDDLSVQFTLTNADQRFLLDNFVVTTGESFIVLPEHIWADQDPLTFTNYDPDQGWPVFSGPYTLLSVSDTEFVYERDDDWWGVAAGFKDLPAPEKLVWVFYGSEETRTAAMARDDLDAIMGIQLGSFLALKQLNPGIVAWTDELPYAWSAGCPRNLDFNHNVEPWGDPEMRWAINYALNRDQIIEIAYEGISSPSRHWFDPAGSLSHYINLAEDAGLYDEYPLMTSDPELAKSMIEEKGWVMNADSGYYEKGGEELGLEIASFDAPEMKAVAGMVVEQLQAVGINAFHNIQPVPAFIDNMLNGTYEAQIFFLCGSNVDPWDTMDHFHIRHLPEEGQPISHYYSNQTYWSSEAAYEFSALVDQIEVLPIGDAAIDELFVEAMGIWLPELPLIPLAVSPKLVPFNQTYWTNWPTAANPYFQPQTWHHGAHIIIHELEPVYP